jgi:hypothetical protein
MTIAAGTVTNEISDLELGNALRSITTDWNVNGSPQNTTITTDQHVLASTGPGEILSGGTMDLSQIGLLTNNMSTIAATGTLIAPSGNVVLVNQANEVVTTQGTTNTTSKTPISGGIVTTLQTNGALVGSPASITTVDQYTPTPGLGFNAGNVSSQGSAGTPAVTVNVPAIAVSAPSISSVGSRAGDVSAQGAASTPTTSGPESASAASGPNTSGVSLGTGNVAPHGSISSPTVGSALEAGSASAPSTSPVTPPATGASGSPRTIGGTTMHNALATPPTPSSMAPVSRASSVVGQSAGSPLAGSSGSGPSTQPVVTLGSLQTPTANVSTSGAAPVSSAPVQAPLTTGPLTIAPLSTPTAVSRTAPSDRAPPGGADSASPAPSDVAPDVRPRLTVSWGDLNTAG